MSNLDKVDFIITVCEADMALSSPERERLCDLLWHLAAKDNNYIVLEIPSIKTMSHQLDLLGLIKEKTTAISKVMDKADFEGDSTRRSVSCIAALNDISLEEYYFWIGFCYLTLAADHQEDPIGKKLEQAELSCLKEIISSNETLNQESFVAVVNRSVKVFKSFL